MAPQGRNGAARSGAGGSPQRRLAAVREPVVRESRPSSLPAARARYRPSAPDAALFHTPLPPNGLSWRVAEDAASPKLANLGTPPHSRTHAA